MLQMLKLIFIKEPLFIIINSILETGRFPSSFKIGNIKPLYNKGDKKEM